MWLSGREDGPALGPPAPLLDVVDDLAARIADHSAALGRRIDLDPLTVLTERAAISGVRRRGDTSCGGATKLLRSADGWLALSLARPEDVELLPAWLGIDPRPDAAAAWAPVAEAVAQRSSEEAVAGGVLLGLPVGGVGSVAPEDDLARRTRLGEASPRSLSEVVVVDLSSLWAGPLCGRILADAGARVVKVESTSRPDGARRGPSAFFDLMNAGKESVAVDFATDPGRETLAALVSSADVVIEASRPRALESLGIDAERLVADGPAVWLSITAYGRAPAERDRVGFGDDTAAAGGAVLHDDRGPCFCGDAIADPLTGLAAAAEVLDALHTGGRWLLDVALARTAAAAAGPQLDVGGLEPCPPPMPASRGTAAALGTDNDRVLGALGA